MSLDVGLSSKPPKGIQLCCYLDLTLWKSKQWTLLSHAVPWLWSTELWDSKCVVLRCWICYSIKREHAPAWETSLRFPGHTFLFPASIFSVLFTCIFPLFFIWEAYFDFFQVNRFCNLLHGKTGWLYIRCCLSMLLCY